DGTCVVTVDFIPNHAGSGREPARLPARLPMVLLNGASGIAVALATEIPPHNLNEVARAAAAVVRNPKIGLADLLGLLPGPDFPGGGQIISSPEDVAEAYRSGRGSIRVGDRHHSVDLPRGQWRSVTDE